MVTRIPHRDEYYLHGNRLVHRSPWLDRIKWILIGACAVFMLGTSKVTSSNNAPRTLFENNEQKVSVPVVVYSRYIQSFNKDVDEEKANRIAMSIEKWSDEFKLPPTLMLALAKVESGFNQYSISPVGALGLTQVMVQHHVEKIKRARSELGDPNLFDVDTNIYLGAWVLSDCFKQYKVVDKSLLCYNGSLNKPNGYDKSVIKTKHEIDQILKTRLS